MLVGFTSFLLGGRCMAKDQRDIAKKLGVLNYA